MIIPELIDIRNSSRCVVMLLACYAVTATHCELCSGGKALVELWILHTLTAYRFSLWSLSHFCVYCKNDFVYGVLLCNVWYDKYTTASRPTRTAVPAWQRQSGAA